MKNKKVFLYCLTWLFFQVGSCNAMVANGWNLPPIVLSSYLPGYSMLADSLSMAMDKQGNALAVWKAKSGSNIYVLMARFEVSTNAWNPVVKVLSLANISGQIILSMAATGDAFIMWESHEVPLYTISCTKYENGTTWASWAPTVQTLSTESYLALYGCAVNELGDALFVYSSEVYYSSFYDHTISWTAWSPVAVGIPIALPANTLNITLDNNGQGLVLYSVSSNLFASQYVSSTWSVSGQINAAGTVASQPALVQEPIFGANYIMWIENANSVHATQFGQTSKTLDMLSASTVGQVMEIVDVAGNVTFMWTANSLSSGNLKTTYFNNTSWNSWTPTINTIATSASRPIVHWTMAVQPASPYEIFALWELNNGTQYLVQANEAVGGTWVPVVTQNIFALGNNRAVDPLIGVDASGNALALWGQAITQSTGTTVIVNAIAYNAATALWQAKSTVLSNSGYCNCV
jgi:hypothetical protein